MMHSGDRLCLISPEIMESLKQRDHPKDLDALQIILKHEKGIKTRTNLVYKFFTNLIQLLNITKEDP